MTATDRAFGRLARANPVPHPERFMAGVAEREATLRGIEEGTMASRNSAGVTMTAGSNVRRRWQAAAVAFLAVLAIALGR